MHTITLKIKLPNAIIAATALLEEAYLLTNDVKLQSIQHLKTVQLELK